MGSSSQTQLSAAIALVQLLIEYPDLPEAGWSVGTIFTELHGHVHGGGMAELAAYVDVLGGSVRAGTVTYELQGQQVRAHRLTTVWRDVQVEVVVSLPVSAEAVSV